MIEQEAHERLHQVLPQGSTVTLSRTQRSRSTVGSGPTVQGEDGDWHVTVQLEAAFGPVLEELVAQVIYSVQSLPARSKPPKFASPSRALAEGSERRQVS